MQCGKCICQLLMTPFHRCVLYCLLGAAVLLQTLSPLLATHTPGYEPYTAGQSTGTHYKRATDLNETGEDVYGKPHTLRPNAFRNASGQEKSERPSAHDAKDYKVALDSSGYDLYRNSRTLGPILRVTKSDRLKQNSDVSYGTANFTGAGQELYRKKSHTNEHAREFTSKSYKNDGVDSARAAIVKDLYRTFSSTLTRNNGFTQSSNQTRSFPNVMASELGEMEKNSSASKVTLQFNVPNYHNSIRKIQNTTAPSNISNVVQESDTSNENKSQVVYTVADLMEFLRAMKRRIALAAGESPKSYNYKPVIGSWNRRSDNVSPGSGSLQKFGSREQNYSLNETRINRKGEKSPNIFRSRKSRSWRNSTIRGSRNRKMATEDVANNTSPIIIIKPKTLFNYTYNLSAVDRGSVFPHDPLKEYDSIDREDLLPSPYIIIPSIANKTNSQTNSPKSVYESLKPRLRERNKPPGGDTFWHQRVAHFNPTRQKNETTATPNHRKTTTNLEKETTKRENEMTLLTNPPFTEESRDSQRAYGTKYRSLPVPKRMDSEYETFSTRPMPTEVPTIPKKSVSHHSEDLSLFKEQLMGLIRRKSTIPSTTAQVIFDGNSTEPTEAYPTTVPATIPPETSDSQNLIPLENIVHTLHSNANGSNVFPTDIPDTSTPNPDDVTEPPRRPKMTDTSHATENTAIKKLDQKSFYEYLLKAYAAGNGSLPEYRPGHMFRYDEFFPRKPVLDIYFPRPTPFFKVRTSPATQPPDTTTTPFESRRTSIRVSSTFYPNRMQDVTLRFLPDSAPTTLATPKEDDSSEDEAELRELEEGFTMEKLAYLLIGTCCGLSVLCLLAVIGALRCRRCLLRRRLRRRLGSGPANLKAAAAWATQGLGPGLPDSARSSAGGCSCHCVGWSLGPRNLDSSPAGMYLCGQKKLPFGAASTLRYESMLGRHNQKQQRLTQESSESSQENDSLEQDSDSSGCEGHPRKCTCIGYAMWPMVHDLRPWCPAGGGHYIAGDCGGHPPLERLPKNYPPPVTGSNYLDRSEGVVYWSSNDERLI